MAKKKLKMRDRIYGLYDGQLLESWKRGIDEYADKLPSNTYVRIGLDEHGFTIFDAVYEREETDDEYKARITDEDKARQKRYENYLSLKEEFEGKEYTNA